MRKALIALIVIGMVACGQAVSVPTRAIPSARPFHPPSSWGLFIASSDTFDQPSWALTRLDGATLNDVQSGIAGNGYAVASADGSTLVEVDYNNDNVSAVRVIDARTGTLRRSLQPPFATDPVLTADGSRLLVNDSYGRMYRVFDTRSGRQSGSLLTAESICCGGFPEWLDPTGRFLYGLIVPGSGLAASGPGTPVLVRYDLQSGKEDGRLRLNGVQAGVWQGARIVNVEHVAQTLTPGAALSPDGSQLAVLYQDGTRLMTIDAIRMTVMASRPISVPSSPLSWLGLMPIDADAKYSEGTTWNLVYSPDGRRLFASAEQMHVDESGREQTQGLGVRLIDVATSTLMAELPSVDVPWAVFAPDRSALYGMTWVRDTGGNIRSTLLRFDAQTLAVAARREFTGSRSVMILAR